MQAKALISLSHRKTIIVRTLRNGTVYGFRSSRPLEDKIPRFLSSTSTYFSNMLFRLVVALVCVSVALAGANSAAAVPVKENFITSLGNTITDLTKDHVRVLFSASCLESVFLAFALAGTAGLVFRLQNWYEIIVAFSLFTE